MLESVHAPDVLEGGNSRLGTAFVKCKTMSGGISGARLTLRLLMSYIYGAHILDVSRSHTMTHHSR